MKAVLRSDIGKIKFLNEDLGFIDEHLGLFMLADGLGGHLGGEIASTLAVDTIVNRLTSTLSLNMIANSKSSVSSILVEAIENANNIIYCKGLADPKLKGMGTTIVIAFTQDNLLHIAHAGDSRAYLFQKGKLRRITQDHTLVAELVSAGEIDEKQARQHYLRTFLSSYLGRDKSIKVDLQTLSWRSKDILLLCSDGLTDMVEEGKIAKTLGNLSGDLNQASEELIKVAIEKGGKDNITVILVFHNDN